MKNFLQRIGVLESEAPSAAPLVAASVVVESEPVTEAAPVTEADSAGVPTAMLQNVVNGLRSDLQATGGLTPLFELIAAVNKLKRVPVMKDRILTAIDLVGHDAASLLGFAERYRTEAKRVAEAFFMRCKVQIGDATPKLLSERDEAKRALEELEWKYTAAKKLHEEKCQQVIDADTELAKAEEVAHLAAEILTNEFDETHKALKEAVQ